MSPEEFIDKILSKLNIKYLMVGDDFKFGKERREILIFCLTGDRITRSRLIEFQLIVLKVEG